SENALYDEQISSFGKSELYNHYDAQGFIKLFSLPTRIRSIIKKDKK
ncbi:MAG: argininosuccinate synthase, partial [Bacilli bacterium]